MQVKLWSIFILVLLINMTNLKHSPDKDSELDKPSEKKKKQRRKIAPDRDEDVDDDEEEHIRKRRKASHKIRNLHVQLCRS